MSSSPGQDIVRSVAGPMSCSLATIERYIETLPCAAPWEFDQHTVPVPWRSSLASLTPKRMKIAFLVDDGVVRVQPPNERAVQEVANALRAVGHEGMLLAFRFSGWLLTWGIVFEWDASSHGYAYELWEKAILSDGGEGAKKKIEMTGEPLIEGMLVGTEKDVLTTSETHQVRLAD